MSNHLMASTFPAGVVAESETHVAAKHPVDISYFDNFLPCSHQIVIVPTIIILRSDLKFLNIKRTKS